MKLARYWLLFLLIVALAGCASSGPSPYIQALQEQRALDDAKHQEWMKKTTAYIDTARAEATRRVLASGSTTVPVASATRTGTSSAYRASAFDKKPNGYGWERASVYSRRINGETCIVAEVGLFGNLYATEEPIGLFITDGTHWVKPNLFGDGLDAIIDDSGHKHEFLLAKWFEVAAR